MTTHYQQIHLLKQEVKRLRLLIVAIQSDCHSQVKELKREIIKPRIQLNDAPTHWKEVLRAVCTVTDLTPDEILCPSRKRSKLFARHMFNYICRKRLVMGLTEIGNISHRDHSTIINSVREFGNIMWSDKEVQRQYGKVTVLLNEALES